MGENAPMHNDEDDAYEAGGWGAGMQPRQASAPAVAAVPASPVPAAPQTWMTVEQARAYLQLPSAKSLYQMVRRGTVPVHYLGRLLRFSRAELDRVLTRK